MDCSYLYIVFKSKIIYIKFTPDGIFVFCWNVRDSVSEFLVYVQR